MSNQNTIQPIIQRFMLEESTTQELKKLTPDFGFNGLGELVFRRTYSRDNEDWSDVVTRVIEGCISIRKEHFFRSSLRWIDKDWQPYARKMALSMFKMEWMPPGRGLWMMGTQFTYERGSMSLNNCYSRDTKFWTEDGIKSFEDFENGDYVSVRGRDAWKDASVHSFGSQQLVKLTVGRNSSKREIYTTKNHRWILNDNTIITTEFLTKNMILRSFQNIVELENIFLCDIGIQHGIVYGDGTVNPIVNNCKITLCNDKKSLSKYFYSERRNNPTITGLPITWKSIPNMNMNKEYLFGFLSGWFASDGCVSESSHCTLSNKDKHALEWARNAFSKLDITTSSPRLSREISPFDGSYKPLYTIIIYRNTIPTKFFLRDFHKDRFKPSKTHPDWRVVDIEFTDRKETVWCVVEPELEEFTLEDGILTKNCAATDTVDDLVLSAEWNMDCLMNGVGVGFTTNWRGEAKSPNKEDSEVFVVPDSREGWVESLIKLMCSYINSPRYGKNKFPKFDYSTIRASGSPIKGFGGTASGAGPLKQMHERVEDYLDSFCNRRIKKTAKSFKKLKKNDGTAEWKEVDVEVDKPYSHTRLVADIFNAIGACVVAGNVRRCLPVDSMVHTKYGLVPIQNIKIGDEVLTMDGYEKVKNKFEQGKQKLVKILTQDGTFRCTPNHRMAVCTSYDTYDWKEASKLVSGDKLLSSRTVLCGTKIDSTDEDYISIFGNMDINIDENMIWNIGRRKCNADKDSLRVPYWIFQSKVSFRLAYMAGVADSYDLNEQNFIVTTVFMEFAEDLQKLLYSCGIESRFLSYCGLYNIELTTERSMRKFNAIPQLHSTIKKSNQPSRSGFPTSFETIQQVRDKFGLHSDEQFNIDDYDRQYGECDYTPVEVLKIIDDIEEETYDIEVENRHEFFCNGYLTHNSAEICLGDIDDDDFINLKNYDVNPERSAIGWMSNNSVVLKDDNDYHDFSYIPDIAKRIRDNGEPGIINLYNIQKYGRYGKELPDEATMVNPCMSGDTMIAVADGRGCVSIQQLAEEEKDVPVYSMDPVTYEVSIKWGRHPRITGTDKTLLRVHFGWRNKGEYVDVTPNHKFFLSDGREVEAKDLKSGDSVPQFKKIKFTDGYIRIHTGPRKYKVEHRMIKEFHEKDKFYENYEEGVYNGCCKTHGVVVHHKDENKNNNYPENLEITTASDHNRIHNLEYIGKGNPMYGKHHTDATKKLIGEKAKKRCESLEYRQKIRDGQTPEIRAVSSIRMKKLKSLWDGERCDKIELEAKQSGLDTERVSDSLIRIVKTCENEHCKKQFHALWNRRETSYCSRSCANTKKESIIARKKGQSVAFEEKARLNFLKQIQVYRELEEIKDIVMKKEWENACKLQHVSSRFNAKSPNRWIASGWRQFKEMVIDHNHRVSHVEELEGSHTVYNITVDENHTVAAITKMNDDLSTLNGVFFFQCGEIPLCQMELCNLAETFPPRCDGPERFNEALEFATFYASTVSLLPTHRPETNAVIAKNRRIGISISGIAQWASGAVPKSWGPMNYTRLIKFLRNGYQIVRDTNNELAKAAGVPSSVRVTTVKPSGSISLLAGVTPGVHYPVSRYAIRRVRIGKDSPLIEPLIKAGVPHELDKVSENTFVFEFVIDHGDVRPCAEVSPWEQFSLVQMIQKHYCDNCVSACLTKNHYISTDNGFVRIDRICKSNTEKGFSDHNLSVYNKNGLLEVSEQYYVNGMSDTMKIELVGGRIIQGTPKHKLMILGDNNDMVWKQLSDIKSSDWIVSRTGLNKWGNKKTADNILKKWIYDRKTSSVNVNIPTSMTPELGFWLGCLVSDGCASLSCDSYVRLTQLDNNVKTLWTDITEKIFNIQPTCYEDKRTDSNLYNIHVNCSELNRWVKWIGVYNDNNEKQIPDIIMVSNKSVVKQFIRGLTLDGNVGEKHITVMTTKDKNMLCQLDVLLNNYGIRGSLNLGAKETTNVFPNGKTYTSKEYYNYILSDYQAHRFNNMIGFAENNKTQIFSERFGAKCMTSLEAMITNVPDCSYRTSFRSQILAQFKSKYIKDHFHSLTSQQSLPEISRQTLLQFKDISPNFYIPEHLIDPTYTFTKVKTVDHITELEATYDISVSDTHSYLANGVISHNTIMFDKEKDGPDVEKMLAMFIPNLKSVSMLPHSGHGYEQAPYEALTREEYEKRRDAFVMPDFKKVKGNVPVGSKYCSGDKCEL